MHMVIRAIVYAKTADEALKKGKTIFDRLIENGIVFDWYTTFDDNTSTTSGKARWDNIPPVAKTDSAEGKKLIEEGMKYTRDEFFERTQDLRSILAKYSNAELFETNYLDVSGCGVSFRYTASCIGQYEGCCIWLYNNDGCGIKNPTHLENVLNKWKCNYEKYGIENPYKELDVWVVPADVHY